MRFTFCALVILAIILPKLLHLVLQFYLRTLPFHTTLFYFCYDHYKPTALPQRRSHAQRLLHFNWLQSADSATQQASKWTAASFRITFKCSHSALYILALLAPTQQSVAQPSAAFFKHEIYILLLNKYCFVLLLFIYQILLLPLTHHVPSTTITVTITLYYCFSRQPVVICNNFWQSALSMRRRLPRASYLTTLSVKFSKFRVRVWRVQRSKLAVK